MLPVSSAIPGLGQKMKDGAVVPDVHRLQRPVRCDVGLDPRKCECRPAETGLRAIQRGPRDVECGDAVQPAGHQRVNDAQSPPPTSSTHVSGPRPAASIIRSRIAEQRFEPLSSRSPFAVEPLSQCCLRFIGAARSSACMLHLAIRRGVAQSE